MTSLNCINFFTISDTVGVSLASQWFYIKFSTLRLFYQGSYFLEMYFPVHYHPWSRRCDFFSSFLLPWEQPFLSSCRIPALISMGDESLDFCFCVDIKSWASKRLKPNCGSDVASPDHGGISHYCPLCSDHRIVPSPLQFFFCNSSHVFTLLFKIIKNNI